MSGVREVHVVCLDVEDKLRYLSRGGQKCLKCYLKYFIGSIQKLGMKGLNGIFG